VYSILQLVLNKAVANNKSLFDVFFNSVRITSQYDILKEDYYRWYGKPPKLTRLIWPGAYTTTKSQRYTLARLHTRAQFRSR
jgi:hypothetical protein